MGKIIAQSLTAGRDINISQTINNIKVTLLDPAKLFEFLKKHWPFWTLTFFLQLFLITFWWLYKDRFVIAAWKLLIGTIFLEMVLFTLYNLWTQQDFRKQLVAGMLVSLLSFTGVLAFEVNRIFNPPVFDPDDFGVAVALFGEGPDFRNTEITRDISKSVLQQLTQQASENPDLNFVKFKPIGLVRNDKEATADSQRIGADLVIWGNLQVSEEKTTLNFAILETPDKVSNPRFPRVLPLYKPSATGFITLDSHGSGAITEGTTTISAFTFGLAHFFKWDFASAIRAFDEVPADSPVTNDDYHYLLHIYHGLSLQWPGRLEKANEEFQQAIEIHPDDPAPYIARAFGNKSLGRIQDAEKDANEGVRLCTDRILLNSSDHVAYFDRALAYEVLEDWHSALADYQEAVKYSPDLYIAHIGVIRMELALKQIPEAIQSAQEAIQLANDYDANPAWAYLYLAHAYELDKDIPSAREAFEKAVTFGSDVDWIHFQAGQFYEGTGDTQGLASAENEYRAMAEVSSNLAWAYSTLAKFYARQNRLEEAVPEYRAALRIDPGAAGVWVDLADVYTQLNRTNDARDAYDRAINLEPENFYAQFLYGNFLSDQGELEAAIRQWELAHLINPKHCGLILNTARAYEKLGDQTQANELYRLAISEETEPDASCQAEASLRLGDN